MPGLKVDVPHQWAWLNAELSLGENFYFYRNLPVKWVRVVGVVVAIDEYAGRRIYTVDDSSGACIECMILLSAAGNAGKESAAQSPAPYEGIDVGSVVDVKGGLSTFREEKQITIEKMLALRSTEQEVALWEKRSRFRKDVLETPWILRNRDIRRCRKEAERSEEEAARKKKRLKVVMGHGISKKPVKPPQAATRDDKRSRSNPMLDLRQIIQNEPKGKYDALGL